MSIRPRANISNDKLFSCLFLNPCGPCCTLLPLNCAETKLRHLHEWEKWGGPDYDDEAWSLDDEAWSSSAWSLSKFSLNPGSGVMQFCTPGFGLAKGSRGIRSGPLDLAC